MNYIFAVLIAFTLFPVVISGLAKLSNYLDEKASAIHKNKDEPRHGPAASKIA